jgi:hypothetical protein
MEPLVSMGRSLSGSRNARGRWLLRIQNEIERTFLQKKDDPPHQAPRP